MPESLREQILNAFKQKLEGITEIANLKVERNRGAAAGSYPSLLIYDSDETFTYEHDKICRVSMFVNVIGIVQSSTDTNIGQEVNKLYAEMIQALAADTSLGGKCHDIRATQSDFEIEEGASQPTATFRMDYEVEYFLDHTNPYSVPAV